MTNQQPPITPPPELFAEWFADSLRTLDRKVSEDDRGTTGLIAGAVAIQAARWGADTELEACCEWFRVKGYHPEVYRDLRKARRPKPPSLKEQALDILQYPKDFWSEDEVNTIRRALEQLDD